MQYDLAVVIGKFDPLHAGHIYNINKGLEIANNVLVLVGSAGDGTYLRRERAITEEYEGRVFVEPLSDFLYEENQFLCEVQDIVKMHTPAGNSKITLVGHEVDETSYYLKSFPQYEFFDTGAWPVGDYTNKVDPKNVVNSNIVACSIVLQSGHILLHDDGSMPCAILESTKTLQETAIHNLRERTKLKVPVPVLRGSIVKEKTFSRPTQECERNVVQAFLFQLKDDEPLPKVKDAEWLPLTDFYEMEGEDFHIIKKMIDNE